jgi:ubiquinone/menaquinone biosynthesis C-methylase UbiE
MFSGSVDIITEHFSSVNREAVQQVFGERASFYVDSKAHADQEVLERVRQLCGDLDGRAVLDVATGTGHTALKLAPLARRVVGFDLTRRMLSLAEDTARQRGVGNCSWVLGDVSSLPFPDRSFDVVCSRRAPHHFPDLSAALKEMVRVLKDGGIMVIDDRSVPDDEEVARTMNALDRLHDRSHVREYGAKEWRDALSGAGLLVREVQEYRRHLPLTSLTGNAERADAAEIERTVSALPEGLRKRMAMEELDGTTFLDHYFVTIKATK